jgi:hypothetical protein
MKNTKVIESQNSTPLALLTTYPTSTYDTQFLFGLLMFATGEDRNLELLIRGPAPSHPQSVYGKSPY